MAVCSTEFLNCEGHCPFYHPEVEACEEWTDEQAKEAVETIAALRAQQERDNRLESDSVKPVEIDWVKNGICGATWLECCMCSPGGCSNRLKQDSNPPLTLDELRKMDGEPVWVVSAIGEWPMWYIVDLDKNELKNPWDCIPIDCYDVWPYSAYRHKPEEEPK